MRSTTLSLLSRRSGDRVSWRRGLVRGGPVVYGRHRAEAIRRAVLEARPQDTVLVAGRGHETVQEIAGVDHELDDRAEARAALAQRQERTITA
jgi:UDP-N-acetylmuramoyl-L-alanyl-D-glutamate--2,6-diaminopimelate ligase